MEVIKDLDPNCTPFESQDCHPVLSLRPCPQPPPEAHLLCSSLFALGLLNEEFLSDNSPRDGAQGERDSASLSNCSLSLFSLFFFLLVLLSITFSKPEAAHKLTEAFHLPFPLPASAAFLLALFIRLIVKILRAGALLLVRHNLIYCIRLCLLWAYI